MTARLFIGFFFLTAAWWCTGRAYAAQPLDVVVVMDNSETFVQADSSFLSVSAAELLIELLRPEDRLYLVSCGSTSSIVLRAGGTEKEKCVTSIGMMKRESSANDPVDALRTIVEHARGMKGGKDAEGEGKRKMLVAWFMSSEIRLNVREKGYRTSDRAKKLWKAAKKAGIGKNLFKKKRVRDFHGEIFDAAVKKALSYSQELGAMDVPVNVFVMGKSLSVPGLNGGRAGEELGKIIRSTGGRLEFTSGGSEDFPLDHIISIFVERIAAPTITYSRNNYGKNGAKFEVYRKSANLWVVVLFKTTPPKWMSMVSTDYTSRKTKKWPFGKRKEHVSYRKPELEKGQLFKQKRWYKPPSDPAGFGFFYVHKPVEGIYKVRAHFQRGEEFLIRVFQDIDLEFGFLTKPSSSIPVGEVFTAIAGLTGLEGSSFAFHRSFLNDLEFSVEMEKEGGSVPAWGESRQARFSKEGEVLMTFEPASPGIYYVRGEVTHRRGEFRASLDPFRVEVFHRVDIEFSRESIAWNVPAKEEGFILSPGVRLKPGVKIPEGLVFKMYLDWSKVTNHEKLDISPRRVLEVSGGRQSYMFTVRYKDPASMRLRGAYFEGPLYIKVDKEQERNVSGTGAWVLQVKGRAPPWSLGMYWNEYMAWIDVGLLLLIGVVLLVERRLRPSFDGTMNLNITRKLGNPSATVVTISAGSIRKPALPLRRQRMRIGMDGSVNNQRAAKACEIVAEGKSFSIRPAKFAVKFEHEGTTYSVHTRFAGKPGVTYMVGDGEHEVRFWFTANAAPPPAAGGPAR